MPNFRSDNLSAESIGFSPVPQPYNAPNGTLWLDVAGNDLEILLSGQVRHIPTNALVPILQNSIQFLNTNVPHSITNVVSKTSLYNIALWMESRADGAVGTTLTATITYTAPDGDTNTVTLVLGGTTDNIQQENYVFLAVAGTSITVTTAFSSTSFHYDIAAAVSILPTGV